MVIVVHNTHHPPKGGVFSERTYMTAFLHSMTQFTFGSTFSAYNNPTFLRRKIHKGRGTKVTYKFRKDIDIGELLRKSIDADMITETETAYELFHNGDRMSVSKEQRTLETDFASDDVLSGSRLRLRLNQWWCKGFVMTNQDSAQCIKR